MSNIIFCSVQGGTTCLRWAIRTRLRDCGAFIKLVNSNTRGMKIISVHADGDFSPTLCHKEKKNTAR